LSKCSWVEKIMGVLSPAEGRHTPPGRASATGRAHAKVGFQP
jgi:hypothetical protein